MGKLDLMQSFCCKLHQATQMLMMVDNHGSEMNSKKFCKDGEYGPFEHLLFLFFRYFFPSPHPASFIFSVSYFLSVKIIVSHLLGVNNYTSRGDGLSHLFFISSVMYIIPKLRHDAAGFFLCFFPKPCGIPLNIDTLL